MGSKTFSVEFYILLLSFSKNVSVLFELRFKIAEKNFVDAV